MKFFTRKWKDFIYENYEKFLIEKEDKWYNLYLTYGKENIIYSDKLLKEKFDIYYNNKKKYVESYEYLKKEFGQYEKIELLTYEEEFDNFKNRIKTYSERLKQEAFENIQTKECNVTLKDLENTDFRLLALNLYNGNHRGITDLVTLTNEVMGFLTGMTKNAEDSNKLEYEKLKKSHIWFHDALVLEIGKTKDYSFVVVLDNEIYYRITMANGNASNYIDFYKMNKEDFYYIDTYEYGYCYDKGYYLKLEELEIWGDNIVINQI